MPLSIGFAEPVQIILKKKRISWSSTERIIEKVHLRSLRGISNQSKSLLFFHIFHLLFLSSHTRFKIRHEVKARFNSLACSVHFFERS